MNNLEELKSELLTQKSLIESKGGSVTVANTNPSPSEITSGINSIPLTDFRLVTATQSDVKYGKNFFDSSGNVVSGTNTVEPVDFSVVTAEDADVASGKTYFNSEGTLSTGTFVNDMSSYMSISDLQKIFLWNKDVLSSSPRFTYTIPSGRRYIREYLFFNFKGNMDLYINTDVQEIAQYFVYFGSGITIKNFSSLTNLKTVGSYSFYGAYGIDFANLPNSIEEIKDYAFALAVPEGAQLIKLPSSLKSLKSYGFALDASHKRNVGTLDMSNCTSPQLVTLPNYCFYHMHFNSDFTSPDNIQSIGAYFNYGGNFNHITINSHIASIGNNAFNCPASEAQNLHNTGWIKFESQTPPTIGTNLITSKVLNNSGFRIYVPDESVEAYKAVANLLTYTNFIVGISQFNE